MQSPPKPEKPTLSQVCACINWGSDLVGPDVHRPVGSLIEGGMYPGDQYYPTGLGTSLSSASTASAVFHLEW